MKVSGVVKIKVAGYVISFWNYPYDFQLIGSKIIL